MMILTTETIEGSALSLQSIDDIHSGDSLSLGVLSVSDGISDDVLKEDLEDTSGLLVDQTADTLDTTSAGQSTDGWLGDTLDVITQDFAMSLGASFAQSFTSFSSSGHFLILLSFEFRLYLILTNDEFFAHFSCFFIHGDVLSLCAHFVSLVAHNFSVSDVRNIFQLFLCELL